MTPKLIEIRNENGLIGLYSYDTNKYDIKTAYKRVIELINSVSKKFEERDERAWELGEILYENGFFFVEPYEIYTETI